MPTLTPDQLSSMNFGYLTGSDLIQWCSTSVLIKQYEVNNNILQNGCDLAQSEMIGYFYTKYDMVREFIQMSGRTDIVVKITSILAVRNILGNMAGLSDVTKSHYAWADDIIMKTQDGLFNFPLYAASTANYSSSSLVQSNFKFLG